MEITSIIKNLFLTSDNFSVTGLGTFIAKPKSATIDQKTGQITPPTKEIVFDTRPEQNDTILRDALLNAGLTEEEASMKIAKFVDDVKKALSNNDNYQIPDVGFFYKNRQGLIEFTNISNTSLLPEAAGFNSITFNKSAENKQTKNTKVKKEKVPKVKKTKEPKIPKEKRVKTPKEKAAIKPKVKKEKTLKEKTNKTAIAPKVKKEKTPEEKAKSKKLTRNFLFIVPTVIIIALLAVFYKPILNEGKKLFSSNKDTTIDQINTPIIDATTNDTNNSNLNNQLGNDDEYKKILNSNITNTAEVNLGADYKKFYIIVGSFSTNQNAEQYAKQLRNLGYSPVIIDGTDQRYYRVALGSYDTANNLINDYTDFSNKYGKELWVLINKQ